MPRPFHPARFDRGSGLDPVDAVATFGKRHVEIRDADGLLLAGWAYRDVVLQTRPGPNRPMRLSCHGYPNQILEIRDALTVPAPLHAVLKQRPVDRNALAANTAAHHAARTAQTPVGNGTPPHAQDRATRNRAGPSSATMGGLRPNRDKRTFSAELYGRFADQRGRFGDWAADHSWLSLAGLILIGRRLGLALAAGAAALALGLITLTFLVMVFGAAGTALDLIPQSRHAEWGKRLVAQIEEQAVPFCQNIYGMQAMDRLAERITQAMPTAPFDTPIVHMVDDPRQLMLGLPGGHVLLFRGVIDRARVSDEAAGIMALGLAESALEILPRRLAERHGLDFLLPLILGHWDDRELSLERFLQVVEAVPADDATTDALAIAALTAANLRARGVALFVETARTEPEDMRSFGRAALTLPPYLVIHPAPEERLRSLRRAPRGGQEAMDDLDWAAFRITCD